MSASAKIVAVIQARMGSTRLPGKSLRSFAGRPIIDWVVRRTQVSALTTKIYVATSDLMTDAPLAEHVKNLGVGIFRGSESNVFSRFRAIQEQENADHIIRICADNPFICGKELDRLVDFHIAGEFDYSYNHTPMAGSRYADGFGGEIITRKAFASLCDAALNSEELEHVTLHVWKNPQHFRIGLVPAPLGLDDPSLSFDVDTPADFSELEPIAQSIPLQASAFEVINTYRNLYKGSDHATT